MKTNYSINLLQLTFHTGCIPENHIKKGITERIACKPLICMVGDTGFEPVTSTV